MTKRITLRFSPALTQAMDYLHGLIGVSEVDIIRMALAQFFERMGIDWREHAPGRAVASERHHSDAGRGRLSDASDVPGLGYMYSGVGKKGGVASERHHSDASARSVPPSTPPQEEKEVTSRSDPDGRVGTDALDGGPSRPEGIGEDRREAVDHNNFCAYLVALVNKRRPDPIPPLHSGSMAMLRRRLTGRRVVPEDRGAATPAQVRAVVKHCSASWDPRLLSLISILGIKFWDHWEAAGRPHDLDPQSPSEPPGDAPGAGALPDPEDGNVEERPDGTRWRVYPDGRPEEELVSLAEFKARATEATLPPYLRSPEGREGEGSDTEGSGDDS